MYNLNYFKPWVMFFVVATVGGAVAGFIGGAVLGFMMGAAGASIGSIQIGGGILGFLLSLPISFLAYRWSVQQFVLVQLPPPASEPVSTSGFGPQPWQ
jgi:hypothetical protein